MGNATSSEDAGEQASLESVQTGEDSGATEESLTNFSSLFKPDLLYKALLAIKEPPGSAVSRSKDGMVRWLSGLVDKGEVRAPSERERERERLLQQLPREASLHYSTQ
jgi:hypothetical protein